VQKGFQQIRGGGKSWGEGGWRPDGPGSPLSSLKTDGRPQKEKKQNRGITREQAEEKKEAGRGKRLEGSACVISLTESTRKGVV